MKSGLIEEIFMRAGIYGKKVGMTQVFDESGNAVPVTVIDTKECFITQVKSKTTDGYNALQFGFGACKPQNANKAKVGHFKKASVPVKFTLRELRFEDTSDMTAFKPGQSLTATMFQKGDIIDVIGTSKGLGFTGVVKRYGWHGADATHGASKYYRHGGSNGTNTFPGKVLKNKGAPGHNGNSPVTTIGLKITDVLDKDGLVLVRGAVPGANGSPVFLRYTNRKPAPKDRPFVSA